MKKLLLFLLSILSISLHAQTISWAGHTGSTGSESGKKVCVDNNSNVYIFGRFGGTADLNPGPAVLNYTSVGSEDLYIEKLDSLGSLLWVKVIGGAGNDVMQSAHIDNSGNIYFTGSFELTIDLNPGTGIDNYTASAGTSDGMIVKLDNAGNYIWGRVISGSSSQNLVDVATDNLGNSYYTGSLNGTSDIDPGPAVQYVYAGAQPDIFLLKLDALGNFAWVKVITGLYGGHGRSIIVDASGNIFIGGIFWDVVDFDPGPGVFNMTSIGTWDGFIEKFDASGNMIWAKGFHGADNQGLNDICMDPHGSIYAVGNFEGTLDFDPGPSTHNVVGTGTDYDSYVVKLDSSGNFLWVDVPEGAGNTEWGFSVACDAFGNVYSTGYFENTVDFDDGPGSIFMTSNGDNDIYVNKLDPNGNLVFCKKFGGLNGDYPNDIAINSSGNVYMTGYFYGSADFDPGFGTNIITSFGGSDAFVSCWFRDICSDITFMFDSVLNVGCLGYGYVATHIENGIAPYTYTWNTSPVTNDSIATFYPPGIYTLNIIDANGCIDSATILIGGITDTSGFDLKTNLVVPTLRNGVPANISINSYNYACVPTSGYLRLALDSYLNVISSTPPPDSTYGSNVLIWNFSNFSYGSGALTPSIQIIPSITTPPSYVACITASIFPLAGDNNPADNSSTACRSVVNSHDPNRIDVNPIGICEPHYVVDTQLLTYTIQFQNNGNADAINIYLLDTLDSDLDLYSVRVLANSHPMVTEVLPGNVLKFRYDNIMLPDSTSNEEGSHGYVIYEVKPLPSLSNGTVIENYVGIYFDFNPPVYTNTVFNTINDGTFFAPVTTTTLTGVTITSDQTGMLYQWIDCTSGDSISGATNQSYIALQNGSYAVIISDGCDSDTSECVLILTTGINNFTTSNFSIYPNPSQNKISISTNKPTELFISNLLGELVIKSNVIDKSVIDISHIENGVYFIRNSEGSTIKFIKQ